MNSPIRFTDPNSDNNRFFFVLRQRVDAYFKENGLSRHHDRRMVIKTILLLASYIVPYVLLLAVPLHPWASSLLWMLMGFALAGIGMCVMHDANHGAYSRNRTANRLLGHTINLLGASVSNWKFQHNHLHHTFTNVATHDGDIQDKPMLRFSPHSEVKWYHRGQVFYALLLYSISTLYWTFVKDFVMHFRYISQGVNRNSRRENNWLLVRMAADKLLYAVAFLVLPCTVGQLSFSQMVGGFLLMHVVAGLVLTLVFQLAHTVEGTAYPLADSRGTIENNWAMHQMSTTVNFARGNKWLSWYVGGLNFQVEHHLFPSICHVHYPEISEIVKATAAEFNVPYLENATFGDALQSHFDTLRKFGRLPDLNEVLA